MFWTFLIVSALGAVLIKLGELAVMVVVLASAFKVALVIIVLLTLLLLWRRR